MKILSAEQIRSADEYTIRHEPISSLDLMERASVACVEKLTELYPTTTHFSVFCGTGNNGGDGLAIARLLHTKKYSVSVYLVRFSQNSSADNLFNLDRLQRLPVPVYDVNSIDDVPEELSQTCIVDALVGTGLSRPLSGLLLDVVSYLNKQNCLRIAIDLPSGMFSDADNASSLDKILKASTTLSFQVPKLNFFLPSLFPYTGEIHLLDIGLNDGFLSQQETNFHLLKSDFIAGLLKKRSPYAHKGTFGHALIASGSFGKVGAAVLASKAALRSGAGLVSSYVPRCGYSILQSTIPEVMVHCSESDSILTGSIDVQPYSSIGVGPGIGTDKQTQIFVEELLKSTSAPLILDADALNCISKQKELLKTIPDNSILTPHLKEFERLFGKSESCFQRLQLQQESSMKYNVIIVLKGKHSSVSLPNGLVYFNSTGNPGMATAGSGDVLTGILTGLLAQGYSSVNCVLLGVFLHGLAGDKALESISEEALIASDIIDHLGAAFRSLRNKLTQE